MDGPGVLGECEELGASATRPSVSLGSLRHETCDDEQKVGKGEVDIDAGISVCEARPAAAR